MAVEVMMKGNVGVILATTSYATFKKAIYDYPTSEWYDHRGTIFRADNILWIKEIKK